ncbi:MAG TPA: TonB-dependent receptor plug domain-containing protein, partial [Bacteroidia bacterium]|nr:TonB-dependent receptor plug domain-containing protein [Bacteroidia bacterium]
MKFIYQLIFLLLLLPVLSNAQSSLEGKVTDKKTGEPIVGAAVYIPDTRTGVITDLDGHYSITQLPSRKLMVQVKLIGYGVLTEMIDLSTTHKKDFLLSETILEKSEVVVTGSAFTTDHARSSLSIEPLEKKQLQTVGATNITDAIAQIPGVSGITTGGGISKPVIRGLGYNRIVTVNEGLRQEGQQWGDEHGLEIDQFSADRIEVLKGPASLMYGSDALGGVINILEPVPAAQGTIQAEVNSQYSTNNKMSANSLMAEGNQKGFVWRMRGTYKDAGAYKTPQEAVYNSAFNEQNGNLMLGLNRKWGYQHVHISSYHAKFGLIEGERDSASGQFLSAIGEIIPNGDAYTRRIDLPFQKVDH